MTLHLSNLKQQSHRTQVLQVRNLRRMWWGSSHVATAVHSGLEGPSPEGPPGLDGQQGALPQLTARGSAGLGPGTSLQHGCLRITGNSCVVAGFPPSHTPRKDTIGSVTSPDRQHPRLHSVTNSNSPRLQGGDIEPPPPWLLLTVC